LKKKNKTKPKYTPTRPKKAMDENFRHAMKIGNAELGIPIFDPFVVDHFNVPVKNAHSSLFMTVE
jgi:hypothetical protein